MRQIVDFKMHNFPQIREKKVKVKVEKLDLSKDIQVKLFK